MKLSIGQKVCYPSQGVCVIEDIKTKKFGDKLMSFYLLRTLDDDSTIFVPTENAESVGIREVISPKQYKNLISDLSQDFDEVSPDWKARAREFGEKLQSGNLLDAADVLKKLTFLSHGKKLSLREQNFLDKAKLLIVSEIKNAGFASDENKVEIKINRLVENACAKHAMTNN